MKTDQLKQRPRNPVAMPARQRRAGFHALGRKARRQTERRALRRALGSLDEAP